MPLTLGPSVLDRAAGLPLYQQLADHLRQAITSGDLGAGEALLSEETIASRVGVSRPVVRQAIDVLAHENLLIRRTGAATRVSQPARVRVLDSARFRDEMELLRSGVPHPLQSAFTIDHGIAWEDYRVTTDYSKEPATPADAGFLRIRTGAPVLRRRMVQFAGDQPKQIHRSATPYRLTAKTPVADPARQPWPGGTLAELYSIGHEVTDVTVEGEVRNPSTVERRLLRMDVGSQVLSVVTVFWVGNKPVEVTRQIMPTAQNRLRYQVSL